MLVKNGSVFTETAFVRGDVAIQNDLFVDPAQADEASEKVLDATDCYVIPGLIDLHFHGCKGHDICEGTQEALAAIAEWEAQQGITTICPATMTYPEGILTPVMEAIAAYEQSPKGADLVGVNMEGPFISQSQIGAQNPAYVQHCDLDLFNRLQKCSGDKVKIVNIAPEEPGALDFIRAVEGKVRVSLAHTTADYETTLEAFTAGARQLTHIYNVMPPFLHRAPGPVGAAFDSPSVMVELIADGFHLHPVMVRAVFAMFGKERVILISDSMEATDMGDGDYQLGSQKVTVNNRHAHLVNGTIAGSVSNLMTCLKTAVCDIGIDPIAAVQAATLNPARALGIDDTRGTIEPGKRADCVVLDKDFNIVHVVLRGQLLY